MNRLSTARRAEVLRALVEGCSIRSTVRMTGVAKQTILDLIVATGAACAGYQGQVLRDLACTRIECDEIWCFVGAKQRNIPEKRKNEYGIGDAYTWVALDPDTKLVVTWRVGRRTADDAERFMRDLASRVAGRIQLTTDGYSPYVAAVYLAFGKNIDFAQLVKQYGGPKDDERRYSPAEIIKSEAHVVYGDPDRRAISTSHVERQNLTLRMASRRFTRLTNGFSKKIAGLEDMVAIHYMAYNFCRAHLALGGRSPAMAAGLADHVWKIEEIVALLNPLLLASAA
jgi:IS1 family transposase